jgi:hypothetical protein
MFDMLKQAQSIVKALGIESRLSANTRLVLSEYKTADYMEKQIVGLVRGVYSGDVGGDFIDIMANLISGQLTAAFATAYTDEGYDGALPDFLDAALTQMVVDQYTFVDQYYKDIVDARLDGTPVEPLLSRAGMWANQWNAAYNEAIRLMAAEYGGNLMWILGEADHCETCLALNGIVASGVEWDESGWQPQSQDLQCHGYNCACSLVTTSQRRTRGAAGILAGIS